MAKAHKKYLRAIIGLTLAVIVSVIAQLSVSGTASSQDRVVVWVFDVGQGDAIFIDAPEAQVLIDGGRDGVIIEKLSAVMPFWDDSIDVMINTHPHADHVAGLNYVLDRYQVDRVLVSGQEYNTDVFAYFEDQAEEEIISAGEVIELGAGATLEILWPERSLEGEFLDDPNGGSIVGLLTYGETTVLLTGDIGVEEEERLLEELGPIDVLKVGHQGSKTSSAKSFLEVVDPRFAVISVGENSYGHPHRGVVDRLLQTGAELLRTDLHGDVRILSDGGEPEVTTFDL